MKSSFLILLICLFFVVPVAAQQRYKNYDCKSQGYYDKYSREYLQERDCNDCRGRTIVLEQPYQPGYYNNPYYDNTPANRYIYRYGLHMRMHRGR